MSNGNYDKDYQIVQTAGRTNNDPEFVISGGFSLSASADTQIDSFIDGLVSYSKPTRSAQEHVFVNRFSAPGGPETAGDSLGGPGLDFAHAELSPYNALPYRNLMVRQFGNRGGLRGYLTEHSDAGGLSGSRDTGTYGSVPNYHKTQRNTRTVRRFAGATASYANLGEVETVEKYDNAFITRPIPQSDLQYSWIAELNTSGPAEYSTGNQIEFSTGSEIIFSATLDFTGEDGGPFDPVELALVQPPALNVHVYEDVDVLGGILLGINNHLNETVYPIGYELDFFRNGEEVTWVVGFEGFGSYPETYVTPRYINPSGSLVAHYEAWLGQISWTTGSNQDWANFVGFGQRYQSALHAKRGYGGGWSSWKQMRQVDHPLKRAERKDNYYIVTKQGDEEVGYSINGGRFSLRPSNRRRVFREPPVDSSNKRILHFIDTTETPEGSYTLMEYSFGNERTFFANEGLDQITERPENPETRFEKTLASFGDKNLVNGLGALVYTKRVWPRREKEGLKEALSRKDFIFGYNSNKADRVLATGSTIREYFTTNQIGGVNRSTWPTDYPSGLREGTFATTDLANSSILNFFVSGGWGIGDLVNKYTTYHNGSPLSVVPGALYIRPTIGYNDQASETGAARYKIGGYSYNDKVEPICLPDIALPPMENSYGEWNQAVRNRFNGMSILPEFRISEHIDFYLGQIDAGVRGNTQNNFFSKNENFLTVTGSSIASASAPGFFETYVDSDDNLEMRYILDRNEEVSEGSPKRATLVFNGVKKFLPYDGFYPEQRTRELATIFLEGVQSDSLISLGGSTPNWRTALQPFFGPGILFNSIKAGHAVDFPIKTASFDLCDLYAQAEPHVYTNFPQMGDDRFVHTGTFTRIPFEALAAPATYFGARRVLDIEVHESASINCTASWDGSASPKYLLAMNNFLAEVPGFFLGKDKLTRISSTPADEIRVDPDIDEYIMDVHLTTDKDEYPIQTNPVIPIYGNGGVTPHTTVQARLYQVDATYGNGGGSIHLTPAYLIREGEIYGPPSQHIFLNVANSDPTGTVGYAPYTPPTFTPGGAIARMRFRPYKTDGSLTYTIPEIVASLTSSYYRAGWGAAYEAESFTSQAGGTSYRPLPSGTSAINAMQVSASLNLFEVSEVPVAEFSPNGGPVVIKDPESSQKKHVWSIGPKWETPILYHGAGDTTNGGTSIYNDYQPTNLTASYVLGPWLSEFSLDEYGPVRGVHMRALKPPTETVENVADPALTGSLADLVGFSDDFARIGTIADKHLVREAIVAIPYLDTAEGKRFFEPEDGSPILDEDYRTAVAARYVFPPTFDLRFREGLYLFYMLEFTHEFSKADMANMWNGHAPRLMRSPELAQAAVDVRADLFENEDLRWMIFKVKQRAASNYFKMVGESAKDKRFLTDYELGTLKTAEESFSYNWPYDQFTMIESGKIEVQVIISGEED